MEKLDLVHNGLPTNLKDCFVRLRRLTQKEIKMHARSSERETSDSGLSLGPPKKRFRRIRLPNDDNSEDEDREKGRVHKISIDSERSVGKRKSVIDSEKIAETVKKSDLSHSDGESRKSKKCLAGMSLKEDTNCAIKDAKGNAKKLLVKEFIKKQDAILKNSKRRKENEVRDSGITESSSEENSNSCAILKDSKRHKENEVRDSVITESSSEENSNTCTILKKSKRQKENEVRDSVIPESSSKENSNTCNILNNSKRHKENEVRDLVITESSSEENSNTCTILKKSKRQKENEVRDSVIAESSSEENSDDHKKRMETKKRLIAKCLQYRVESQVASTQPGNCDKDSKDNEMTTQLPCDKSRTKNLDVEISTPKGLGCQEDDTRLQQNEKAACDDVGIEVERVLAEIFDSPPRTYEKNFVNIDENISGDAKVNNEISSKVISQLISKNSVSPKSCDKRDDVPKGVTKSICGIQKNELDSHPSTESNQRHLKLVSGVQNHSSRLNAFDSTIETSLSYSTKEQFSSSESRKDEAPKRVCSKPFVSANKRHEIIKRRKSMPGFVADSGSQNIFSNDPQKNTNRNSGSPSVKPLSSQNNGTKRLTSKPDPSNCSVTEFNEKVSRVEGDSCDGGNGILQKTSRKVGRPKKKGTKRSFSAGNTVGEADNQHYRNTSATSQPQKPLPVKSKFRKIDGDWRVSPVYKNTNAKSSSNEESDESSDNKERLHFFARDTSGSNLSKVIEKCRQKVGASVKTKRKGSSDNLLDNTNKPDQVVRTPLNITKPSIPSACGNKAPTKEADSLPLVSTSSELTKAVSTPEVVSKCRTLSEDVNRDSLGKSNPEENQSFDSPLELNERSLSPHGPAIVAQNIEELMKEFEQLTSRAAAAKTSAKKRTERKPSQKKMLTMFGEEHLIEDNLSILHIPLGNKEKSFPGKQSLSNESVMDAVSPADKVPERDLSYQKSIAGKRRNFSESIERKKHFQKIRRNSSGTSSDRVSISEKDLASIQTNLSSKCKPFTKKKCSVTSSDEVISSSAGNSNGVDGKSQIGAKKSRKAAERRVSFEKDVEETERSQISNPSLKVTELPRQQGKSELISIVGGHTGIYEGDPKNPKHTENHLVPKEKENVVRSAGEDSTKITEADDGHFTSLMEDEVTSEVPTELAHCHLLVSPSSDHLPSATISSTTAKRDKDIEADASQISISRKVVTEKTVYSRSKSLVDNEAKECPKKLEDVDASLSLSLRLIADIPVASMSAVQKSSENRRDDGQKKTDVPNDEYVKSLEEHYERLEQVAGEVMAKKYMIWKELQSYHGIVEIKEEIPDDSSDDELKIVLSDEDVSCNKEDSRSAVKTQVFDWLNDSAHAQKNVPNVGQVSQVSLCEESGHLNPNPDVPAHSRSKHDSNVNSIAPSADEHRRESEELNEKEKSRSILMKETSGCVEITNGKNLGETVGESAAGAILVDLNSSGIAISANSTEKAGQSSTAQQKENQAPNMPELSLDGPLLTGGGGQPDSQPNTVIVFRNSNVSQPLLCSPNQIHSAQVVDKPTTILGLEKEVGEALQSGRKEPTVEHSRKNLSDELVNIESGTADMNSSANEVTAMNLNENSDAVVLSNAVSVREDRIRVRGMEDLLATPPAKSPKTTIDIGMGNDHLKKCFVSEEGMKLFLELASYLLKIAKKIEASMLKNPPFQKENSEIEDIFKNNCLLIYSLFKSVIIRYKGDPHDLITVLFMTMALQWKNFKGLVTIDILKSVIRKCFKSCVELISSGNHHMFVSEANHVLARLNIFPPLVLGNLRAVNNTAGISNEAVLRRIHEANKVLQSSDSTTATLSNVEFPSGNGNINYMNYTPGACVGNDTARPLEYPSHTAQVQHPQGLHHNNQVQMIPNMVNDECVTGQNTVHPASENNESARAPMSFNTNPTVGQPSPDYSSIRNMLLNNPAAIPHLQHLIALSRNPHISGSANPGPSMNGQNLGLQNSPYNVSFPNVTQTPGRRIQPKYDFSQSQQQYAPSYAPSSSNVSSRVYQPSAMDGYFPGASNSAQGSVTQGQDRRQRLYPNPALQVTPQMSSQNAFGTAGSSLPYHPASSNQIANNTLSSSGGNVTQPQVLSAMRPSMFGSYYNGNVGSSTNDAVRSSLPSMAASGVGSHSAAQQFSSNHLNSAPVLHAQGNPLPSAPSITVPGRRPSLVESGQPVNSSAVNPIMRQSIEARQLPQAQVSQNNNISGRNAFQVSHQAAVNPHVPYNSGNSSASLSSGSPSELVRTVARNPTDFSGAAVSQHANYNRIFQNHNQQSPHAHGLSTTSAMNAQSYPQHQFLRTHTQGASGHNSPCESNSSNIVSSSISDDMRLPSGNLNFQQNRTGVATAGNSLGQSQVSAKNSSAFHTFLNRNPHEASSDNPMLSRMLNSNTGRDLSPSYPYTMSLMKQAEMRSSLQQPLPAPAPTTSTSPGDFAEDGDQGRGQGTNRSVSRDSGYRSPSQVFEVDSCYVCKKEARHTCSGCKSVFYCHHGCQMGDWERHKWECRPIN